MMSILIYKIKVLPQNQGVFARELQHQDCWVSMFLQLEFLRPEYQQNSTLQLQYAGLLHIQFQLISNDFLHIILFRAECMRLD